jgi:hypothetical protein
MQTRKRYICKTDSRIGSRLQSYDTSPIYFFLKESVMGLAGYNTGITRGTAR